MRNPRVDGGAGGGSSSAGRPATAPVKALYVTRQGRPSATIRNDRSGTDVTFTSSPGKPVRSRIVGTAALIRLCSGSGTVRRSVGVGPATTGRGTVPGPTAKGAGSSTLAEAI